MPARRIFVIGATGAQGIPVCEGLLKDGGYSLRILTRDPNSKRAKAIVALGDVEVTEGTFASEADLRKGLRGCWGAFVNIDGFNCGEKAEMFWTARAYELAIEEGVRFYVHGNIDYAYKKSGYDPIVYAGHMNAKGRMGSWILAQNKDNRARMGAALFTTGMYMEMNFSAGTVLTPRIEDGVVTWRTPLGENGGMPFVALDDCGPYVRWLFDHTEESNGMDLEVGIAPIHYRDIVAAFKKVTGHPAQWIDTSFDDYFANFPFPADEVPAAYNADIADPASMSFRANFTGWWNLWRRCPGNTGIIKRDYALLDKIFPGRIKTAEEWIRKQDEKLKAQGKGGLWDSLQEGNMQSVLKFTEDGRKGRL